MATTPYIVTTAYEQLTDGTKTVQFQIIDGFIELVDSASQPAQTAQGFRLSISEGIITVSPPTRAWVRANSGSSTKIIIIG